MADGFPIKVDVAKARKEMAQINYRVNRASAYAVREAGRKVKQAARRKAPVYRGPERTMKVDGHDLPVISGELKKSIGSSKRLRTVPGGGYVLRVGPRGGRVHLYAARQEERQHFMAAAHEAVAPLMPAIYEKAVRNAARTAQRRA